jgi:hypothetical protein
MRWLLPVALLAAAVSARAQQPQPISLPSPPVAGAPFIVHVIALCAGPGGTTINGSNIDINVTQGALCCGGCFTSFDVTVPPLPAGSYTIRLVSSSSPSGFATLPITVTAGVPALGTPLLTVLAIALIALAVVKLRVS